MSYLLFSVGPWSKSNQKSLHGCNVIKLPIHIFDNLETLHLSQTKKKHHGGPRRILCGQFDCKKYDIETAKTSFMHVIRETKLMLISALMTQIPRQSQAL